MCLQCEALFVSFIRCYVGILICEPYRIAAAAFSLLERTENLNISWILLSKCIIVSNAVIYCFVELICM